MPTLEFEGQLLTAKDGEYISTEGNNKGQAYHWTDLQFHTAKDGVFTLRTVAPVAIPAAEMGKVRKWSLDMVVKVSGNKTTLKVGSISGAKSSKE